MAKVDVERIVLAYSGGLDTSVAINISLINMYKRWVVVSNPQYTASFEHYDTVGSPYQQALSDIPAIESGVCRVGVNLSFQSCSHFQRRRDILFTDTRRDVIAHVCSSCIIWQEGLENIRIGSTQTWVRNKMRNNDLLLGCGHASAALRSAS